MEVNMGVLKTISLTVFDIFISTTTWMIITGTACKNEEFIPYCAASYWMQNQDNNPDNAILSNRLQIPPTLAYTPHYKLITWRYV